MTVAEREDLVIGRVRQPTLPRSGFTLNSRSGYSFDGILDDIRIFDYALVPAEIAKAYAEVQVPAGDVLPWAVLPAGPPDRADSAVSTPRLSLTTCGMRRAALPLTPMWWYVSIRPQFAWFSGRERITPAIG